jgi:hypothetical protein
MATGKRPSAATKARLSQDRAIIDGQRRLVVVALMKVARAPAHLKNLYTNRAALAKANMATALQEIM